MKTGDGMILFAGQRAGHFSFGGIEEFRCAYSAPGDRRQPVSLPGASANDLEQAPGRWCDPPLALGGSVGFGSDMDIRRGSRSGCRRRRAQNTRGGK